MKKFLQFVGYVPVILVGLLGAYLVFHMWQLSEVGRDGHRGIAKARSAELAGQQQLSPGGTDPHPSSTAQDH
ncbi:MAG: hypothetical protein JO025_09425 [Verrucomicrobia bacterium]|nr:hypothetical protein [Verrucomicrobiota bacterium]